LETSFDRKTAIWCIFLQKWLVFQKHKKTLFFDRQKIPRASLPRKNFGVWV